MTRKPGSFLLSLIAKTRAELPRAVTELSDAELIRELARCLSDLLREAVPEALPNSSGDDDFAAFACMFAFDLADGPNKAKTIADAADLLADIGLEFDPEQSRAIGHSDAFAEFREKLHRFEPGSLEDRPREEIAVWYAELWACARRACGVAVEFS
jgi:hypothetical protein